MKCETSGRKPCTVNRYEDANGNIWSKIKENRNKVIIVLVSILAVGLIFLFATMPGSIGGDVAEAAGWGLIGGGIATGSIVITVIGIILVGIAQMSG